MIDHTARVEGVIKAKLKEHAMGQPVGFSVSQCYAPVPDQNGNITGIGPSWLIMVSIPHPLPMIGQGTPDIAVSVPVGGVLPPDALLAQVAQGLLEKCREEAEKIKANKPSAVGMSLNGVGK